MNLDLLMRIWQLRYPALRQEAPAAAAREHVVDSIARLPPLYRAGLVTALRLVPPAFRSTTGSSPLNASNAVLLRGVRRVERLPVLGLALRTAEALALYGGLDAVPAGPRARAHAGQGAR